MENKTQFSSFEHYLIMVGIRTDESDFEYEP